MFGRPSSLEEYISDVYSQIRKVEKFAEDRRTSFLDRKKSARKCEERTK